MTRTASFRAGGSIFRFVLDRLVHFFGRQQRSGTDADQAARANSQGKSRGGDIVRHVGDEYNVVLAEAEVHRFEFAAHSFDGFLYGSLASGAGVFDDSL